MSFQLSFRGDYSALREAHWLDDLPDVSSKDSTRQDAVDDSLLIGK